MTFADRPSRTLRWTVMALMSVTVMGCDFKGDPLETMGVRAPAPDEFRVIARKPLQLPPSATLPEPTPGAPSPLEPDPNQDAIVALLGTSDTVVTSVPGGDPSEGEQLLLRAANTAAANREIRTQLEEDTRQAAAEAEDGPYQPPSLLELLSLDGDEEGPDPDTLIDPITESQRLQRAGVASPNDPRAEPLPEPEVAAEGAPSEFPRVGTNQRPSNTLSTLLPPETEDATGDAGENGATTE